jgi:peroxiredoxin family protein
MGQQVSMFFTFWGLSVLKKDSQLSGKTLFQKMMALMSPRSSKGLPVSKMNYFGVGAKMLRSMMKEKNVSSLEEMISLARELGVRMIACEMSRDLMGIKESELVGDLECAGRERSGSVRRIVGPHCEGAPKKWQNFGKWLLGHPRSDIASFEVHGLDFRLPLIQELGHRAHG